MRFVTARSRTLLLALLLFSADSAAKAEVRAWRYRETGESFRAELVGFAAGHVRLRRAEDGSLLTVDARQLGLADLLYLYEQMQQPVAREEPAAVPESAPAASDADPPPAVAEGTLEIEIEASPPLDEQVAQPIQADLAQQIRSHGPLPDETRTTVRLALEIRSQKVDDFRLGRHAMVISDYSAVWRISIRRGRGTSRRRAVSLYSGELEVTSQELLNAPPASVQPVIDQEQLQGRLRDSAIAALQAWRIPEEVFAVEGSSASD